MAKISSRKLEDLDLTREEVDALGNALKNEEFRKLLNEYVEEINDPENKKTYQNEITQLELERGIDCKFVNPEPGFVLKTSANGNQKAFINICENSLIGKPSSTPMVQGNTKGLNWSLPFSQSPGREDYDKKKNICLVYDVIFHPDTLYLSRKNPSFKKIVVETALNAVEDSFKLTLDKINITFPKMKYKGFAHASVIRTKSKQPSSLTQDEMKEFDETFGYPYDKVNEKTEPVIKEYVKKKNIESYSTPSYLIKYSSDIDLKEFTYDKNAKLNSTIPKNIIIHIDLPLLSSTKQLTLDVMEKSLHLVSESPAKYKLDLQLPYNVLEEKGNAKFDSESRKLVVTLPVKKRDVNEFVREDSGVESDFCDKNSLGEESSPSESMENDSELRTNDKIEVISEQSIDECFETEFPTDSDEEFLNSSYHYSLPEFKTLTDMDKLVFVLKVKNCDPESVIYKFIDTNAFHLKLTSIGSGYFPIYYAFCLKLEDGFVIDDNISNVEAWDNNVIVKINLKSLDEVLVKYYVGLNEKELSEHTLKTPLTLGKILADIDTSNNENDDEVVVTVNNVDFDSVSFDLNGKVKDCGEDNEKNESVENDKINLEKNDTAVNSELDQNDNENEGEDDNDDVDEDDDDDDGDNDNENVSSEHHSLNQGPKQRTLSEGGEMLEPVMHKSILKNRIMRSLSESNADDYALSSSFDSISLFDSDSMIHESNEENVSKNMKKTVRFSDKIKKQTFRSNCSILQQKKKNQKRNRNKRKLLIRRASESENSEVEDKEMNKSESKSVIQKRKQDSYRFKSDLIFDLDI